MGRPIDNDISIRRPKRKRRRRQRSEDDPPFVVLVLQVGTVLFLLLVMTYHFYLFLYPSAMSSNDITVFADGDDNTEEQLQAEYHNGVDAANGDQALKQEQALKLSELLHPKDDNNQHKQPLLKNETAKPRKTAPPLPHFNLSAFSQWDAYGMVDKLQALSQNNQPTRNDTMSYDKFWNATASLQQQFSKLYGGERASRMLLDQALTTFRDAVEEASFPPDIVATACRLHQAKQEHRPFRMAFGGYSVTTGRGNHHQDSYPFQIQRILEPLAKLAGIPSIQVHNAAIGGCPSFPYGWCMKQFWGIASNDTVAGTTIHTPDVVSWEFGMNEATGGSEGLEAYVRQLLSTYSTSMQDVLTAPPKLIVKDHSTAKYRKQLLAEYANLLLDPVVIHTDKATQVFLERDEEFRPPGFQRWREFGAPHGAPGQAYHHPAVQEHKLNGWLLTMHFMAAMEYMVSMSTSNNNADSWCPALSFQHRDPTQNDVTKSSQVVLPPPVSGKIMNDTNLHYDSFLFGRPLDTGDTDHEQHWTINPIQCRTSFQPKLSGDLTEIVASGTIAEDLEVTLPKSQYYYNRGWTWDLSQSEKSAKKKLSLYPDSLGFKDSKEAYYGIYESGTMTLLLPFESKANDGNGPKVGDNASTWFDSIILCQVNERTYEEHPDACNFATDVSFTIGGANVTSNHTKMVHTIGAVYLGKPICKHIQTPPGARLTSHNELLIEDEKASKALQIDQVGLLVEVFVSNPRIVHIHQACSISHVVWQERQVLAGIQ
jgi:hypothetical protein